MPDLSEGDAMEDGVELAIARTVELRTAGCQSPRKGRNIDALLTPVRDISAGGGLSRSHQG